jgi:carbon-monoxide dehydrogenase large subunit
MATEAHEEEQAEIRGIGHSVKRKEDGRLIRGKGTFIDDMQLPGMLYMSILRSPFAHATINGIDTSRAQAVPGVVAVVTGELMAQHNLAWMPTMSGDTQAVLATDKVRFQGQEVAAVIAEDPYIAKDAVELIDVDYDALGVVVSPQQALASDAPVIRDEKEGQSDNHIYHWESGDAEATDRAFAQADRVVSLDTFYPRSHPAPLETCGCIADVNSATGQTTIYMTSQAPHAIRTVFALVTGLPEENIRIVSPDLGGGFGNKVPVYPGYVVATAASLLLGRPVKWIEDRSENLISTGFARDFHMHGELALKDDGTMLGLRTSLLADEGAFHADAQPSKLKVGLYHEQGARRGGISMLVPRHGGVLHDRAARPERRVRARDGSGGPPEEELHPPGAVPVRDADGARLRLGRLSRGDGPRPRDDRLRRAPERAGATACRWQALGRRHRIVHGGGRSRSP